MTDGAGTRSFNYYESWTNNGYDAELRNKSGRLQAESLASFLGGSGWTLAYDYQYGVTGRSNGPLASIQLNGASTYAATYGYDAKLRLGAVGYSAGQQSFTPLDYAYVDNANLVHTLTQSTGGTFGYQRDYDYETSSNRLQTLKHAWSTTPSKQVESRLTYDNLGLRQTEKTRGTELMSALSGPANGIHADYSYTDRLELDLSGTSQLDAAWGVGGAIASSGRDYDYDAIGNRTFDHAGPYTADSLNQYSDTPYDGGAALTYDANGNLTFDGARGYGYDGENRLVTVTQGTATFTYKYDYLGRRIAKSGSGIGETRYVCDGWNLIAELDSGNGIIRKYVWGLDVSGTLQGAGGVGGLLLIEDGAAQYYPIYDGSHNVIGLYDSTGNTDTADEYDPFGNLVGSGGSYAATNPFRFSTRYTDAETGLVYYGMRFHDPRIGRFLNRDPIAENGGVNLHGFVGNDPVNRWDYLGQRSPEEEAARRAREEAERAAGREAIEQNGLIGFFVFGMGDAHVDSAGQAAYNGVLSAFSTNFDSIVNDPSPELRGMVQASVDAGRWDLVSQRAIAYNSLTDVPANRGPGLGTRILDGAQTVIGIVGLIPVVGEAADLVNAGISTGRYAATGNTQYRNDAALSVAAMIPVAGMVAGGAQIVRGVDNVIDAGQSGGLVIGKMDDLGRATGWRPGDHALHLPPLPPGPGRWEQNARELQHAIDQGRPIRDISPTQGGGFLERERQLLQQNGWRFDPQTGLWTPGG